MPGFFVKWVTSGSISWHRLLRRNHFIVRNNDKKAPTMHQAYKCTPMIIGTTAQ